MADDSPSPEHDSFDIKTEASLSYRRIVEDSVA